MRLNVVKFTINTRILHGSEYEMWGHGSATVKRDNFFLQGSLVTRNPSPRNELSSMRSSKERNYSIPCLANTVESYYSHYVPPNGSTFFVNFS